MIVFILYSCITNTFQTFPFKMKTVLLSLMILQVWLGLAGSSAAYDVTGVATAWGSTGTMSKAGTLARIAERLNSAGMARSDTFPLFVVPRHPQEYIIVLNTWQIYSPICKSRSFWAFIIGPELEFLFCQILFIKWVTSPAQIQSRKLYGGMNTGRHVS